jgi:hypothetical protein
MPKSYDQAYFDRWYRDRSQRVISPAELELKVRLTLAVAQYHLGRPVRSVLDVGCGEDSSEYVVQRYGRSRNLRLLRFGQLAEQRFDASVDLLICADMMHYVPTAELSRGLSGFAELCHGVAYLEVMCGNDDFVGDHEGYIGRTANWYRKTFAKAGFLSCGNHCYLSEALRQRAMALELC